MCLGVVSVILRNFNGDFSRDFSKDLCLYSIGGFSRKPLHRFLQRYLGGIRQELFQKLHQEKFFKESVLKHFLRITQDTSLVISPEFCPRIPPQIYTKISPSGQLEIRPRIITKIFSRILPRLAPNIFPKIPSGISSGILPGVPQLTNS